MMVKACEGGHIGVVKHLIKLGITDVEGPDGLNGLAIALGQLDSDLVSILGDPEVQPKAPEFLCDIFEELAPQLVKPLRLNYVLREFSFQGDISLNRCTGMYAYIDTITK